MLRGMVVGRKDALLQGGCFVQTGWAIISAEGQLCNGFRYANDALSAENGTNAFGRHGVSRWERLGCSTVNEDRLTYRVTWIPSKAVRIVNSFIA